MSDDIVKRLREVENYPDKVIRQRILEAADEIENLRAALKPFADLEIVTAAQWEGDIALYAIAASKLRAARAALGEKE